MLQNFRTFQLALAFYRETKKLPLKGEIRDQEVQAIMLILENKELAQQIDKIAASCHRLLQAVLAA